MSRSVVNGPTIVVGVPTETYLRFNRAPVCPHCGHELIDVGDLGDVDETDCEKCGEPYRVTRHVTITYSTAKRREVP